jgi:hypothetical protein
MLKFALIAGICIEWLCGPPVQNVFALGPALLRGFMLTLAAWMALEAARALWRAVRALPARR